MSKARERAKVFCSRVPRAGLGSNTDSLAFDSFVGPGPLTKDADGKSKKVFESRQKEMEASKFARTFCNDFAGECARTSTGTFMGAIFPPLKDFILKGPKPYAWVDKDDGPKPQMGDILGFKNGTNMHLGVAVEVKGSTLYKCEGGQGGIIQKQDRILWTDCPWPVPNLVGWVDIDLWVYGPKYSDSQISPEGTWTVWMNKRTARYAYKFDDNKVTWRDVFNGQTGPGTWSFEDEGLVIRWKSGSKDVWELPLSFSGTKGYEDSKGEPRLDIYATKP